MSIEKIISNLAGRIALILRIIPPYYLGKSSRIVISQKMTVNEVFMFYHSIAPNQREQSLPTITANIFLWLLLASTYLERTIDIHENDMCAKKNGGSTLGGKSN